MSFCVNKLISSPPGGEDTGEGEKCFRSTLTPTLSRQRAREIIV